MARADRYALRIPDRYADSVRWRRRRAGRAEAIPPVFLVLGGTAGLVYQVLGPDEARGAEVARAARLSASATSAALRVLAEHGLAERGPAGWRRGAVALADVAESTGAADLQRDRGRAVQAGPGELAGPAPGVPGLPGSCRSCPATAGRPLTRPNGYGDAAQPLAGARRDVVRGPPHGDGIG